MSHLSVKRYLTVALSLAGSATLLFSCRGKISPTQYDPETLMTESSENRTVIMSENGRVSYEFVTPLVEGYAMAANPYREFRRGVRIKTFTSDTLPLVDATLRANYAIYYENQKLWEAKGNVIIYKYNREEGDTAAVSRTEVYTQQLFWNAKTKQIYSNVDTKVLQPDGWHFGVGFDADESLKNIHFRKYSSEMEFEMTDEEQNGSGSAGDKGSAKKSDAGSPRSSGKTVEKRSPQPDMTRQSDKRPGSISGGATANARHITEGRNGTDMESHEIKNPTNMGSRQSMTDITGGGAAKSAVGGASDSSDTRASVVQRDAAADILTEDK